MGTVSLEHDFDQVKKLVEGSAKIKGRQGIVGFGLHGPEAWWAGHGFRRHISDSGPLFAASESLGDLLPRLAIHHSRGRRPSKPPALRAWFPCRMLASILPQRSLEQELKVSLGSVLLLLIQLRRMLLEHSSNNTSNQLKYYWLLGRRQRRPLPVLPLEPPVPPLLIIARNDEDNHDIRSRICTKFPFVAGGSVLRGHVGRPPHSTRSSRSGRQRTHCPPSRPESVFGAEQMS